jgi:hypothetical protein
MNTTSILVALTGLLIRLALPLAVTALVVILLRRLDARWQAEAEREHKALVKDELPCWKEQGLSVDEIKLFAAKSNQPCWQTRRLGNGYLWEECLDCDVFLTAPTPVVKRANAHT